MIAPEFSGKTNSIPWLPRSRLLESLCHQRPQCWKWVIYVTTKREDVNHLGQLGGVLQIRINIPLNIWYMPHDKDYIPYVWFLQLYDHLFVQSAIYVLITSLVPGPLLAKKTPFYGYMHPVKNLRRYDDRLRFIMVIPIPLRRCLLNK